VLEQLHIFVNDRLVKSADVQLDSNFQPQILASEQAVLVLEAPAMPVCSLHQLYYDI